METTTNNALEELKKLIELLDTDKAKLLSLQIHSIPEYVTTFGGQKFLAWENINIYLEIKRM